MQLEILCTPKFDSEESSAVDAIAALLGISREDAVREAVKFFAAECVRTPDVEIMNFTRVTISPRVVISVFSWGWRLGKTSIKG